MDKKSCVKIYANDVIFDFTITSSDKKLSKYKYKELQNGCPIITKGIKAYHTIKH